MERRLLGVAWRRPSNQDEVRELNFKLNIFIDTYCGDVSDPLLIVLSSRGELLPIGLTSLFSGVSVDA